MARVVPASLNRVVGDTLPGPRGQWLLTRREPYGVTLRITA
jgi:hypothetical protein